MFNDLFTAEECVEFSIDLCQFIRCKFLRDFGPVKKEEEEFYVVSVNINDGVILLYLNKEDTTPLYTLPFTLTFKS